MTSPSAFGLYIHWPFCAAKCPYCDFNSHVRRTPPDQKRYLAAFDREMATTAERFEHVSQKWEPVLGQKHASENHAPIVQSIFFGGGTPSLMEPATVAGLIDSARRHFRVAENVEITLEANPSSVEAGRFRGYADAGVNRVSIGVQSLRDEVLKFLGRLHSAEEARRAVEIAASLFPRFSFDLMYARPEQTLNEWQAELDEAFAFSPQHLSLYQLTIEPETPFFALHQAGKLKVPEGDLARAFFEKTLEWTEARGLPAYEISNHAAKGYECQHNLVYWRSQPYAGIGPGAHGRLDFGAERRATATEKNPEAWLELVERQGHGLVVDEALSLEERGDEFLLMGLRLREGIAPHDFSALSGKALDPRRIADLIEHGMIEQLDNGRLRTTPEGMVVMDAVVADLAA